MGESDYYIDEKIMNVISEKITGLELLPNFSMGKKKASHTETDIINWSEIMRAAAGCGPLVLEVQVWTVRCDEQQGVRARITPWSIKASEWKL